MPTMTTPSAPREDSLGSFEMLWDCPHCDTKKNLGVTHRHCPNCGAPQDASKRYFPSEAEKVAVADHAFTGADRLCGSCGAAQSIKAHNCGRCGAPLDGTKSVAPVVEKVPFKPKGRSWGWYILAAVVLLSVLIWYRCIRKKSIELDVQGHRWATSIAIEEYREVGESKWRNEVPTGARGVSCAGKQRSTKEVPDGETCNKIRRDKGDGTFEEVNQCTPKTRSEPVYDDFCEYRIDRWTEIEQLKKNGTGLDVAWPEAPPASTLTGPGARRPGERKGIYTLELNDGKKVRTCDVSESTWRKYKDGQHVKAKARASSGELVCSSL
jgi:ribosomal protein L40E